MPFAVAGCARKRKGRSFERPESATALFCCYAGSGLRVKSAATSEYGSEPSPNGRADTADTS